MDVQHGDGDSDVVLVPQPTNDPNDPLNWATWRKEYHFWLLWVWGLLAAACDNWNGPVWNELAKDYHTTLTQLNMSSALCYLFLGIGCIMLQPIAMKFGRRPAYMLGTLFAIVGCIIGGLSTSNGMFAAVNVLTGIGGAPVDSLVQITVTDTFFAHEIGARLSLFIFTLYAGSYLGPVAAAYIDTSQGWRWCYWYLLIFFGVFLVLQFFTMEESTYRRPTLEAQMALNNMFTGQEPDVEAKIPAKEEEKDMKMVKTNSVTDSAKSAHASVTQDAPPPPKTYLQHLALWETKMIDRRPFWLVAIMPFCLLTYPATVWAAFVYGVSIMWLSYTTTTQSEMFSVAPYNMSVSAVGLTNFASLIGGIFGMIWGGQFADWWTLKLTRKNKGVMEPEFRLWSLIVPAVINTGGLFMYGFGAEYGQHWILSAGFGQALIAFGIGSSGAIAITYAVDCYPMLASESLVLILFGRNLLGTGFTFAIQPWLDACGVQNTTFAVAIICFFSNMSFLIFTWKGKELRAWTAERYLKASLQKERWGAMP
ncbi:hypothetical protein KEM56_005515 [Ascosphaera pollenicola]|nr:hypothetical protein KEM56_005515 [Ascosphaera pollenicola]